MPPRDPNRLQLDFPALVADLIDQLKLTGTVGVLEFTPSVQPVYLVGDRGLSIAAEPPVLESSEIIFNGATNPAAGLPMSDTGQLAAGTYDISASVSFIGSLASVANGGFHLLHRNAADTATLATMLSVVPSTSTINGLGQYPVRGHVVALNERFRWITPADVFTGRVETVIAAAARPVP